jgi:hypothetical protein
MSFLVLAVFILGARRDIGSSSPAGIKPKGSCFQAKWLFCTALSSLSIVMTRALRQMSGI